MLTRENKITHTFKSLYNQKAKRFATITHLF